MTKNTENNNVKPVSDDDLEMWAKYIGLGQLPENGERQIERLANRVVSLGDMTSVVNYLVDLGKQEQMQYTSMAIERLTIMEYIVTEKLEVSNEEMQAYAERYYEELEKAKELMRKAQETPEEETETTEPLVVGNHTIKKVEGKPDTSSIGWGEAEEVKTKSPCEL